MEIGFTILIILQIILKWLLYPYYWIQSLKSTKKIPPIIDPILKLSASELSQRIRKREITSVLVVTAYIQRILEVNTIINAVVENRFAEALKDAQHVDEYLAQNIVSEEEIKTERPLLGIPLTVKESCSLKGMSSSVGSKKRIGLKAPEDCEAVRKLKNAGAIPLLISNTPELSLAWETNNLVTGRTNNPYNSNLTAGGSSGGEGALLAAGASVIGLGSDVAGSIRVPSMFNGIFGHKPTPRIISISGHCPMSTDERVADYLVVGPMTRYADDLKTIMKVLVDDTFAKQLNLDEEVDLSKVTVYFMESAGNSKILSKVDTEIKMAMRKSIRHLANQRRTKVADFKFNMEHICEMCISEFFNLRDIPSVMQDPIDGETKNSFCLEFVKYMFGSSQCSMNGLFFYILQKTRLWIPKRKYNYYHSQAENLKKDFLEKLNDNGIFLYPTFPCAAFQHNKIFSCTPPVMYTMVFNVLGFPSTHVPLGKNSAGLPIGIQVVAGPFQDRLCLAVAQELEKCFGGWIEP